MRPDPPPYPPDRPTVTSHVGTRDTYLESQKLPRNSLICIFKVNSTQVAKRGGVSLSLLRFRRFFPKIDFWATTWSEDVQNIFLESLEVFENFRKIFCKIFLLGDSKWNWLKVPHVKKSLPFWAFSAPCRSDFLHGGPSVNSA